MFAGLLSGAATALVLLIVAAVLPGVPLAWVAALIPISAALVSAASVGSILHWRKVTGHAAVHGAILVTALLVLVGAQMPRAAEVIAAGRADGLLALVTAAPWRAAVELVSFPPSDPGQVAPALAAAGELVGRDRLWIFALAELALIAVVARWMGRRALAAPFCATCSAWCVRERGVLERCGHDAAPAVVRQRAAARDWRYFRDLGPARGGASLRFDLDRCPRCKRSSAINVMWERPLWRDRCLVGNLRLGSDDIRTILNLVEAEPKPQPA